MSYDTNKTFAFYHQGKVFHIYRITRSVARGIDTNGVAKEYGITNVLYPDEDVTNGIRVEYTALENPFIEESQESSNVSYSSKHISFSGNNFISEVDDSGNNMGNFGDFAQGDRIRVQGSKNNDGYYSLTSTSSTGLGKSGNFVEEAKGELITITQVPVGVSSPTELSHVNLNRMLSLAVVDYLKAMMAEREGDLEQKEYYMRNFHKKVSDNESNKNKIYISQSTSYAVK